MHVIHSLVTKIYKGYLGTWDYKKSKKKKKKKKKKEKKLAAVVSEVTKILTYSQWFINPLINKTNSNVTLRIVLF